MRSRSSPMMTPSHTRPSITTRGPRMMRAQIMGSLRRDHPTRGAEPAPDEEDQDGARRVGRHRGVRDRHLQVPHVVEREPAKPLVDRKSTRLNSSHLGISYAVFCLKKK